MHNSYTKQEIILSVLLDTDFQLNNNCNPFQESVTFQIRKQNNNDKNEL